MNVKKDWHIEFDKDQIEALEGDSFRRILSRPKGREDWAAALEDARNLVRPAAVWDFKAVREIIHEQVVLQDGIRIGNGPVASVVAGASELILAVCTAGPELAARVQELKHGGSMMRSLLLDDLGSWAVDSVRQQLCKLMEDEAATTGLHVSTSLSPGESVWDLKDQRVFFSLLDTALIGVSLSPSLVMSPLKSLSVLMGRGKEKMGHEGGSNCDFCSIKDRCQFRGKRPHGADKE